MTDLAEKYNDLHSAIRHNPAPFEYSDIEKILAEIEGEQDGDDWHWILKLKDGQFAYAFGGCDYTGWD